LGAELLIRRQLLYRFEFLTVCLAFLAAAASAGDEPATVVPSDVRAVIEVRLSEAAENASAKSIDIFVAGNLKALGQWKPDGLRLKRSEDGLYRGEVSAPAGTLLEFKLTQGTWALVEKDRAGRDIRNRRVEVSPTADGTPQRIPVTVERWASSDPVESVTNGTLVRHENFKSAHLSEARTVSVWLPPNYADSDERYSVLYLHDGQNLFDAATAAFGVEWKVDETSARLIESNEIRAVIVVGIWNTSERIDEYTLTKDSRTGHGGQGLAYIRFVADELKPFIDRTYRTRSERESTLIGGSSLGGLISMHACVERPEMFGGCIALSPSLGWDGERFLKSFESGLTWPDKVRFWFSMGTKEGRNAESHAVNSSRSRRLAAQLKPNPEGTTAGIRFQEFPDAGHDEAAWSNQLPAALKFLLDPRDPTSDAHGSQRR
jgi:predicted alpha/beta superfamily hydrolase